MSRPRKWFAAVVDRLDTARLTVDGDDHRCARLISASIHAVPRACATARACVDAVRWAPQREVWRVLAGFADAVGVVGGGVTGCAAEATGGLFPELLAGGFGVWAPPLL